MHGYYNDRFSNRAEIAKYLGVSRIQLYRYEKVHPLPLKAWAKHATRLKKEDIETWKDQMRKVARKKDVRFYL